MTKKTFNAAKTNEIACFRSEMFHFTPACCCVANFFCHDCVFLSFPLSEIFSRAEHPLALGMNTSGCPSWILPHVVLSHVHSEFPAACACSSAPWLSTLLSGTFLQTQTQQSFLFQVNLWGFLCHKLKTLTLAVALYESKSILCSWIKLIENKILQILYTFISKPTYI